CDYEWALSNIKQVVLQHLRELAPKMELKVNIYAHQIENTTGMDIKVTPEAIVGAPREGAEYDSALAKRFCTVNVIGKYALSDPKLICKLKRGIDQALGGGILSGIAMPDF